MYIPKYYREENRRTLMDFMRLHNFAALVTFDGERPVATHTPVEVIESDDSLTIYGHISRANPQKHTFDGREALLIFQGAHTYISARWYDEVDVPTWDYMIVHAGGPLREVAGDDLYGLLSRLVEKQEQRSSYRLETLPQEMVQKEIRGVVGFAMDVKRLEGGWKLSQGRSEAERASIVRELEGRGDEDSRKVAAAIREQGEE